MDIRKGIIVDGILHEGIDAQVLSCPNCSLYSLCAKNNYSVCLEDVLDCGGFIEIGKIKIEREEE